MRKTVWLAAIALAGFGEANATGFPVNFLIPMQIREIPSDITNLDVKCTIDAPSRHWESSAPVHLGAGRFDGTVAVHFSLPEPVPYDATWECKLLWGDRAIAYLLSERRLGAIFRVIDDHGAFRSGPDRHY